MGAANQMNQMLEAMNRNGLRVTEQRRTLMQIFTDHEKYLTPKDVYNHMSKLYPSVSFGTVYRNLRLLSDMGVLEQVYFMDSGLKFKRCCLTHHHHHLICLGCEKTVPFDFCPMDHLMDLPKNFKVTDHRFEIYGFCEQCQIYSAITKPRSQ
ncbi:Fur family transcriptional regulator [Paenibacillus senegalensis]|uniref:Fur family transcriptional regulator n=1 Tax=Paenibacillus senegalensis TaxID=1465766 RepID=UPI0002885D63|nr:Fur family transcriptional regulator [Paenibacillus senegalensis]